MQQTLFLPLGTHIPSDAPLPFPTNFAVTWKIFTGMYSIFLIPWLVFFEWTETVYSECSRRCFFNSIGIQVFRKWYTYNSNNKYIELVIQFLQLRQAFASYARRKDTTHFYFFTQEDILMFEFQNIILKALFECWHIRITTGTFACRRNHRNPHEFLPFLSKLFGCHMNIFS